MKAERKTPRYPDNLWLRGAVAMSGRTVKELAKAIGYSRPIVSQVINGHYKGINIVPKLKEELGIK